MLRFIIILIFITFSLNIFCQEDIIIDQKDLVHFTDSFVSLIQKDDFIQAYKMTDEFYPDNEMTHDEFVQYFQTIKRYYGQITDCQLSNNLTPSKNNSENQIRTFGDINFEYAKGMIFWRFIKNKDGMIKLNHFGLMIKDYTQIEGLIALAKRDLELIKIGDYDEIYNSTKLYKEFTSKDKFIKDLEKIVVNELDEYQLKRHHIRVSKNKTYINLNFEINNKGDVLMLEYISIDEEIYLNYLQFFFE
jgi:hypothetical protein